MIPMTRFRRGVLMMSVENLYTKVTPLSISTVNLTKQINSVRDEGFMTKKFNQFAHKITESK